MNKVANICKQSKQRGNALVLLLLIRTWEGEEPPTRDELATLAHISTRQAERDLLKLVEDGEVEKVGRRGVYTHFRVRHLTGVSDESDNQLTDTADTQLPDVTVAAPHLTDMSATSDIPLSDSSDTSVRCESGTRVAPYSDIRTSTDTPQPSVEGAGAPPPPRPRRKVIPHPSAKQETDHQRLMRVLAQRLKGIPDGGKQGKYAKWLLDHGYTVAECEECLDDLLAQEWRDTRVDWYEVSKQIGAWKARKENGSSKEIATAARTGVVRGGFDRANVSARTDRQNSNASALIRGAAERRAAASVGVRGGGEPADS